ncbi:MAG: hypothetical protein CME64_10950 [Halobacteriovoraceae bacterium]|nr:hypothetical protein [Halobacteriovoraceae bacterium]|tara:strand:- start:119392 stop:120678 length:1287 start_codon:yes stop_codon:yes gene_type:complete
MPMRIQALAITILSVLSISYVQAATESSCEGTHKYILIHGIGGSASSFKDMKGALEAQESCSEAYHFNYKTKDSSLIVNDFSKELNQFIKDLPNSKNKKDITLIMHSQGGLVGLNWLIQAHKNSEGFDKDQVERIKNYISLSTPFLGSDFAMMGESVFFSLGLDSNIISPFGKRQLHNMKYGSSFYQGLIEFFTSKEGLKFQEFVRKNIKVLNISAMAPYKDYVFTKHVSQFFEGDLVVNTPSMKLNFLYANWTDQKEAKHKRFSLGEFAHSYGTHMEAGPGDGIAEVPSECKEISKCDHEGYLSMRQFLDQDQPINDESIGSNIRGFDLHIIATFPEELKSLDEAEVTMQLSENISLSNYRLKGASQTPVNIIGNKAYFIIKGTIVSDRIQENATLVLDHPDLQETTTKVTVEKGTATFIKADFSNK